MSIGAEGEHVGASPRGDGPSDSADAVTSFVERTKALDGRGLIKFPGDTAAAPEPAKASWFKPSHGVVAAAVAVVLGGGFIAGAQLLASPATVAAVPVAPPAETTAQMLHRVEDQVHTLKVSLDSLRATADAARQDDVIRGLKRSVDVLKQDLEVAKAGTAGAVTQLSSKIDKIDRDPTPKLNEISARLDRLDRSDKTPNPKLNEISARLDQIKTDPSATAKLGDITARLDRIEHSITSPITTGSVAAPPQKSAAVVPPKGMAVVAPQKAAAVVTPSVPLVQPKAVTPVPPKPATIEGWMLRDVYDGVALLEGRAGGLREVAPGQFVPGVGEIRSIERRGRGWVVVTSRGIIEADNRW